MARRLLVAVALVVAAVPSNGKGWFALQRSGAAPAATAREVPVRRARPAPAPSTSTTTSTTTTTTTTLPAPAPPPEAPAPAPTPAPAPPVEPAPAAPPPSEPVAAAAPVVVARVPPSGVTIYAHPDDPEPATTVTGTTEFGTPRVLLTTRTASTATVDDPWIEVYLPTRPNGATGWVRTPRVELVAVEDRITVDLAARTVTWQRGAETVGVVRAAVGAARTPTPSGTYFVTDVLPAARVGAAPDGEYGAWVVALNGHSDAFTTFDGGDARIAIHGTNRPESIGTAASSGCVRIGAGALDALAQHVPLGTPVVIG